jgi:hypothetical protein
MLNIEGEGNFIIRNSLFDIRYSKGEACMHIEYQCSGGYGGLRLTYQGETDALPAADAKVLLGLIEAANIFDLTQKQLSKKARSIPDDFACRLTLSKAGKQKTLSFNELGVPENLRRLSVHLRKLALKKQGG